MYFKMVGNFESIRKFTCNWWLWSLDSKYLSLICRLAKILHVMLCIIPKRSVFSFLDCYCKISGKIKQWRWNVNLEIYELHYRVIIIGKYYCAIWNFIRKYCCPWTCDTKQNKVIKNSLSNLVCWVRYEHNVSGPW